MALSTSTDLHHLGLDQPATPELQALRSTLGDFGVTIADKRQALRAHAAEAQRLDHEWEEMLRIHREKLSRLGADGGILSRVAEDLRLDFDILRHSLRRWMFEIDRNF